MSVRVLSLGVLAALIVLIVAVVLAVLRLSVLLERTSGLLARDARSMEVITEAELNLFDHQQFSNLRLVVNDPVAAAQADAAREAEERDLRRALEAARAYAGSEREVELIDRAAADVQAYLTERVRLEALGLEFDAILPRIRPSVERATATLTALRELNEQQVEAAHAYARRTSARMQLAALVLAAASALLLATVAWWTRHSLLQPIVAIRDAIERYREGRPLQIPRGNMPRELHEIGEELTAMSAMLQRRREQQMAFLAAVAHELRNPLFAMRTSAAVLSRSLAEEARGALAILERQLDRLSRLANDVIDIGRMEAGRFRLEMTDFDLRNAVRAAVQLHSAIAHGHEVTLAVPDEPVTMRGDEGRIEQVIGNLVSNAIKYSPAGGRIAVLLSCTDEEASIAVADEGIGIGEEELAHLFTPFERRSEERHKVPGAGLGLFVVKRIVDAHGGAVEVESKVQCGSTFRVRLPRQARKHDRETPGAARSEA